MSGKHARDWGPRLFSTILGAVSILENCLGGRRDTRRKACD